MDVKLRVRRSESRKLEQYLDSAGVLPDEESNNTLEQVVAQLSQITTHWVKVVALELGYDWEAEDTKALTLPYGSYPLNVHTRASDLDVVCFVPFYVTKQHFFVLLHNILEETAGITGLQIVDKAKVPLLKFKYQRLPIDLACAWVMKPNIPDDLEVLDDSIFDMVHVQGVDAINGPRDVNAIRMIVRRDDEHYQTAVRAIKLWAKQNGIYSGVLGYFSGIAIIIMVARLRQRHRTRSCAFLVHQFFRIYSAWNWPEPVFLYDIEKKNGAFPVWDWEDDLDHPCHQMPIISPAYPCNSVTSRVTPITFRFLCEKLIQGRDICEHIRVGNAGWEDLFKSVSILELCEKFVEIKFLMPVAHEPVDEPLHLPSRNVEEHLESCKGICRANLKHLIEAIEKGTSGDICGIPDPSAYRSPTKVKRPHFIFYVGLMKMGENMQLIKDFDMKEKEAHLLRQFMYFKSRITRDPIEGQQNFIQFISRDRIAPDVTKW